jgi:hypothetical protein
VRIDRLSHVVGARTDILLLNWSTSLRPLRLDAE